MKIDLYNNYDTFKTEQWQNSAINRWYNDIGLSVKDIENHSCFSDIAVLVSIRNSFWHVMNFNEKCVWGSCWSNVYKLSRFIRPKTLRKLEQLVIDLDIREQRLEQQRQKIQSLRQANTESLKRDQDNEAKGSHSHSLHKQTVTYESAGECPYF